MSLRLPMRLHPDSTCDFLTGFDVVVDRTAPRRFELKFEIEGDVGALAFPAWDDAAPWAHSHFRVMLRAAGDAAFYEFRLSPRRAWSAARVAGPGGPARELKDFPPPGIDGYPTWPEPKTISPTRREWRDLAKRSLTVWAALNLESLLPLPLELPWQLAFGALIEDKRGRQSRWALAHPPGPPDFEHPDGFALELPAARHYRSPAERRP